MKTIIHLLLMWALFCPHSQAQTLPKMPKGVEEEILDSAEAWPDDGDVLRSKDYETKSERRKGGYGPTLSDPKRHLRIGCECRDGLYSRTKGSGACSNHGGVKRWLYQGQENELVGKRMVGETPEYQPPYQPTQQQPNDSTWWPFGQEQGGQTGDADTGERPTYRQPPPSYTPPPAYPMGDIIALVVASMATATGAAATLYLLVRKKWGSAHKKIGNDNRPQLPS